MTDPPEQPTPPRTGWTAPDRVLRPIAEGPPVPASERFRQMIDRIPRGVVAGLVVIVVGAVLVATSDVSLGTLGVGLMSIGFGMALLFLNLAGMRAVATAARRSDSEPGWVLLAGPFLAIRAVFGGLLILFGLLITAVGLRII